MRKIISAIIIFCLVINAVSISSVFATEGYHDAYSEISTFADYYEKSDNITIGANYMSFAANSWISYKVDFGTAGARVFYMNYTIPDNYAGRTITVYLDSMDSTPVLAFNTTSTGSWSNYVIDEFVLDAPITGEHIVYLTATRSGTCDNKAFGFKSSYTEISGPEFTLKDENGDETENLSDAKTLTADASFLSYADKDASAYLIMETLDSNFHYMADIQVDSALDVNGKERTYMLDVSQDLSSIEDANFFSVLLDENFMPLSDAVVLNAPEVTDSSYTTKNAIDYYIDNTTVTLYGSILDNSTKTLLGVRRSDVSINDYSAYEVIYETGVADGIYSFTFNMDEETPTGTYTAVYVTDSGSSGTMDFHYSRPGDIVDAFEEINSSSAPAVGDEVVENTIDDELNQWKDTLGIDLTYINESEDRDWMYTRLHERLPFNDLNELNNAIEQTIFLNKINTTGNYIENIEMYETVIGLSEDPYYKKYFVVEDNMLPDAEKNLLAEKLDNLLEDEIPLTSVERFNELFREALALTMLSNQVSWGSIDETIIEFEEILDTEYVDKYKKFSNANRKRVSQKFLNTDLSSITEVVDLLKNTYNAVYDEIEDEEDSKGGSSGGRGGGGGRNSSSSSSKGFVAEVPKIERPETVVTESPEPEEVISFDDLAGFEWASDAILYLAKEGIINGKSENIFSPADNISREEFVKILVLALSSVDESAVCDFSDVSSSAWYHPYIATAYNKGWLNGYEDGSFGIGENITREQMATMLYRAILDIDGATEVVNSTVSFVDYEQISEYAADAVMNLAKAEIMNGVGMGVFEPGRNASRAEAAVLVHKYLINR